jgi:hypothetical protein
MALSSIEVATFIAVGIASLSAAKARCASEGTRINHNSNS